MALDTNIVGSNLDAGSNVKVALTNTPEYVGSVRMFSENDPGDVTGSPTLKSPETSQDYRLRVGIDTILFTDTFNATAQNTYNWSYTFNTLTATQPGAGTINFGNVQGTASGHGAFIRSYQYFSLIGTAPLACEVTFGQFTAALVTNELFAVGLGLPSAAGILPTDGVYLQLTSAGLIGVIAYNGTTTQTGTLKNIGDITVGSLFKSVIVVGESDVEFWLDDNLLGTLTSPNANGQPYQTPNLPVFMQRFCTGAVSNTNTMRVSDINVSLLDIQYPRSAAVMAATEGQMGYVGQNGGTMGTTQAVGTITTGSTPLLPTSAAGSNTTANVTGLGGWGAINAAVGAATDFIATSFQNPAGGINQTPRNLIVHGVRISTINTGAAVATTPTTLLWSVAFGHTAVSLQTGETASFANNTTHAPRRLQLGFQSAAVGAAIGARYSDDIFLPLTTPIVVRPGEFIATIMKIVVGTATASQTITFNVAFDSYFD
jgi:hypothetical protein